ncbi:hypothetical protein GCM10008018_18420 [Paenibacillus marchantiophytorum]|uniref:Uncharacterized protein n=1 Tax=Paenibacillus marchantiophytorum TaxID=1619310 RepID=A0ABQ2BVE2_9BACL|nr:hypothetical protein GCM10008018_18420 [Paenibacillus marchantiophytorum]
MLYIGRVASHLKTTLPEIRDYVKGKGEVGEYLYETYLNCMKEHYVKSRVIWDIATIAYLIEQNWTTNELVDSPILSEDFRWSFDASRHFIRYVVCYHNF